MVAASSDYLEENTCDLVSMCKQSAMGFHISLRETFMESVLLRVMKKSDKSAAMHISQAFGTLLQVDCLNVTRLFRHSSNDAFCSLLFWKYIIYEGHLNCCRKCRLLRREFLLPAVNMLTKWLGFHISLKETFSKSRFLIVMKKFHKSAAMHVSEVF